MKDYLTEEEINDLISKSKIVSDNFNSKKEKESNLNANLESLSLERDSKSLLNNLSPQQKQNMGLLLDVQGEITVELGRTTIKVKDILSLGEGSIIELNKSANEAVDLIVNNKPFAKGEVVVIDENFGTRITHILNLNQQILSSKEDNSY